MDFIFIIVYFLTMILCGAVVYFFLLHIYFMCTNKTTIEYKEKLDNGKKNIPNIYDNGVWHAVYDVMGNPLLWLVPIRQESKHNGYSYDINKEVYNKLMLENSNRARRHSFGRSI